MTFKAETSALELFLVFILLFVQFWQKKIYIFFDIMANNDIDNDYFDGREDDDSEDEIYEPEHESEHSDIQSDDDDLYEQFEEQATAHEQHLFQSKDKKIQYSAEPLPYARPPASVSGIISNEGKFSLKIIMSTIAKITCFFL